MVLNKPAEKVKFKHSSMPNIVPAARYYPKLSEVITVDDLPEFLSFVQDGLNSIFDKIHYKNLQYSKSVNGDSAFYSLEIVAKRLEIPLPYDMALVLNPDITGNDDTISSFPITLEYQWEILAFLKTFNLENFSFSLEEFYGIGLKVFRISDDEVLAHILNYFVEPEDAETTKFEQFVEDFNLHKNSIPEYDNIDDLTLPTEPSVSSLVNEVNGLGIQNKKFSLLLFGLYILDTDLEITRTRLQQFYNIMVPDGIENYLKKLLIPRAKASLSLRTGIEFPDTILRPVTEQGVLIQNAKSIFIFAEAQLLFDTEAGIGYQVELGGSLYPEPGFAEIGKSGILLQIDTLKLDLSKKTNIPEADADGRPDDFIGVYARAISVTLPPRWFHNDAVQGTSTTTLRLGGYDLLIGTGGLSGVFMLESVPIGQTNEPVDYFENEFNFVFPVTVFQKNQSTGVVEEYVTDTIEELKEKLFPANSSEIPPCSLKFPLSLIQKPPLSPVLKVFNNAIDYQKYLNSLNLDGQGNPNLMWKTIGSSDGFKVGFSRFDIAFKQNKVISSSIEGQLEIKKFVHPTTNEPVKIGIHGHLSDDGDFNLTASAAPPYPIKFPDVFTYSIKTLELGKEDSDFYIGTSGTIQFEGFLRDTLKLGPIEIERLRIYSDGSIEFVGGSVQLIEPIVLPLGPVEITVSAIHYGSHQKEVNGVMRKFNYFGFDGGVSIDPLGIEVRGDGVKYYYCVDDIDGHDIPHPYLHIQTLHLDLTIPAKSGSLAQINGWVTIPEPGISKEYAGGVTLELPKAKLAGEANLRLYPKYPAFIVDCELEPTIPIPLGNFAIYGFRGLLGYRYVAEKEAIGMVSGTNTWYEYYKAPKKGINIDKFSKPDKTANYSTPVSIGAGVTMGTNGDDGYAFSLKAMALLSVPSLFMIDGKAAVLKKRLGLDDTKDPPFFAFVAVGDDSLELGFGADYKLPDNGKILAVYADVQAGFFFRNQKPWYINIGTNINPVTGRILDLINLKSYVMLSAKGIEAGARGEFNFNRTYLGVIKIKAHAFVEVGGKVSFERPQIGGYLMAGVSINAKVLFFRAQIQVGIMFGVEAPRPFLIYGKFYFKVKVRIKVCGIRITIFKFSGNLEVVWNINKNIDRSPINPFYVRLNEDSTISEIQQLELVQGISMLTNEPFSLAYLGDTVPEPLVPASKILDYIIPLDTYIDIKTEKGLLPGNVLNSNDSIRKLLGGINNPAKEFEDLIPPVTSIKGRSIRQVKHQYSIDDLEIKFWNTTKGAWDDYHPYEALFPNDPTVSSLKVGQFQKIDGKYNAVRLMATTPFSYTEQGQPGWNIPEQYGVTASTLFCQGELISHKCADFISKPLNSRYYCGNVNTPVFSNGVSFHLITENVNSDYATIVDELNGFNFSKSLSFNNGNGMEILLPEPSIMMRLKLSNGGQGVKVKFYSIIQNEHTDPLLNVVYGNPNPFASNQYEPLELLLSENDLVDEIRYNFNYDEVGEWEPIHTDWLPLSKIIIEPVFDPTIAQQITNLTEQIELTEYENQLINMGISEGDIISTENLQQELQDLFCELDGHSSGFINKYQKTTQAEYHYSKEFREIDKNVIYSIGTIYGKGLITKLNTDGSVIWEREYTIEGVSVSPVFKRIIKISDGAEKYHYVILVTTPDKVYLLSINPETGEQGWFNFVDWRVSSYYLHVDIVSSRNSEEFYLTVSDKLSSIFLINGFTGEIINNRELDLGANNIDFLTMQGLCEDNQGVTLIGKYRIHNNENIQSVLFKLSHDLLILESVMFDDNVSLLHDVKALNHKRLLSGYNNQQDCVFVLLVDGTGIYNAYNIPNTEKHNSFIQLCQEGFYILLYDSNNDNGRIMLINYNFQILWNKEIHLSSGSNGIRNFTFNQVTKKFTFNCYNQNEDSLVVYANKNLQTCLTTILDNPQIYHTTTEVSNISSSAQIRTNIRVVDNSTISNTIISDIKEYCPSVGCGEEDKELCELYSAIKIINENYLANPSLVSETEFNALSNYFVEILSIVGSFNPTYKLVEYLSIELKEIDKFIHERNLQNYNAAWNAVQSILSYLNEKGNCVCECKPNEFTLIHQVCWLSIQDYEYNINIPSIEAITADAEETVRGITDYIQPIWRPNTSYYIRFKLKDKVDNGLRLEEKSYAYGFTTSGPLGYFHTEEKSTYGDIKLKLNDRLLKEDNHYYIVGNQGLLNEDESLYVSNVNGFILEDTTGFLKDAITKAFVYHPNTTERIKVVAHPDKYSLTSLKQYIDYNRSYPNADGNLLSAKPLFYNDETEEENDTTTQIQLFFSKAYVTHFFRKWDSYKTDSDIAGRLKIIIKDPSEGTEIVNPPYLDYNPADTEYTFIPQTTLEWIPEQTPQVPFAINHYLNMYNSPNCIGNITIVKPASEYVAVFPKYLKPNKLYTVIVNNLYDINQNGNFEDTVSINEIREIHRFVFKTSRYKDFNDQINSFYLSSDYNGVTHNRESIFKIEKSFTIDEIDCSYITIMNWLRDENNQEPLTGLNSEIITNLMNRYQHPFDRVVEGILGLNPLNEAISTEVNIVKDLNTNTVFALIVRNPEPFNNPKYGKEILHDTVQVITDGTLNDNYKIMYSKDNSQVIIMNVAKNINENIILKFKYKLYEDLQLPGNPTPIPGNHPIFNYPVKREASLTINLLNHL